jgi:hypothetical protein
MESAVECGIILQHDPGLYSLTKLGQILHRDPLTRANIDFVEKVCYKALFHYTESLQSNNPAGLFEISDSRTVYDGLSQLDPEIRKAWLRFDHYYSDSAFNAALSVLFGPRGTENRYELGHLIDLGANTGAFARSFLAFQNTASIRLHWQKSNSGASPQM